MEEQKELFHEVNESYTMLEAINEAKRCLHCKVPQCKKGCPISHDIPDWIHELSKGNLGNAMKIINDKSNLPAVCGRVCPHEKQCEGHCVLSKKGQAIHIGKLERFIADFDGGMGLIRENLQPKTRGRIAVIGSGPAGLTIAGDLARKGFNVEIFEMEPEPGGVLMFGIPEYRLPKEIVRREIKKIEEDYAKTETPVVSNNSAHRWTPDVPMVVPEINADHFEVIKDQKKRLGTTRGFIAVKPNCSIQSYAPCLAAWKEFGPKELVVTTYQAISGAGKTFKDWPEMVGNIIPFIGGEEEKSEQEPLRVLGKVENGQIVKAELPKITCQCVRVPVLNGHTAAVFINFEKKPTKEQLIEKLVAFKGFPQEAELPSAPKQFIQYLEEDNRPQVTEDVNYERGMGVSIGRLREDTMFDYKFIGLSHNTVRGAAGGAVLCAEALTAKGYIAAK